MRGAGAGGRSELTRELVTRVTQLAVDSNLDESQSLFACTIGDALRLKIIAI